MEITLQYFEGCPNWKVADQHINELVQEFPEITVSRHLVDTVEEAELVGFSGSPSILFDGVDPLPRRMHRLGLHAAAMSPRMALRAHRLLTSCERS